MNEASLSGQSVHFKGVTKTFVARDGTRTNVIGSVDLEIEARQFIAIVGPSGSGKSTLLRLAGGLLHPDAGMVRVGGEPPQPGPGIGFVFQNFRLIPWRTAAQNVAFALEAAGLDAAGRNARAHETLTAVGLGAWAAHYPAQLSGGMQQRVALARALVGQPSLLLMDEPFASLDAQTRELMQEDLLDLHTRRNPTIVFVTHSVDEALLLADRVIVMGHGTILDDVSIDLPRPRSIADAQSTDQYGRLRTRLWEQIRRLVLADPLSAFFGRKP